MKRSAEYVMEIGSDIIVMVKTNTKGFYKDNTEKSTNYFPRGSYLVLNSYPMVTEDRALMAIV